MNEPEENHVRVRIVHNGKFHFSIFEGIHPSWCHLKVLQGNYRTLVIFAQPQDYIGTAIATAVEHLAIQTANLFGLDPTKTTYIQYTPPKVLKPLFDPLDDDDILKTLERISLSMDGPSDEKYERIYYNWSTSDEDILLRHQARDPGWKLITPIEFARLLQELNETNAS